MSSPTEPWVLGLAKTLEGGNKIPRCERLFCRFLVEYLGDRLAFAAGEAEGALAGGHEEVLVGESHGVADGGVEVGGGDGVFDNRGSGFVGLAVDLAATDAAAGDEVGEGFREVVASAGGGDFWSASKLGGEDDEGGVEESLAVEVCEECGEGPVDDRDGGFHLFEVVIVPVVSAHFDIDVADAAFDEATGKEDSFGEVFSAVAFVDLFGFLGKVEGFEVFAVHEGDRFFEDLIVGPDVLLAGVVFGVELLVEESAEGELAVEFLFRWFPLSRVMFCSPASALPMGRGATSGSMNPAPGCPLPVLTVTKEGRVGLTRPASLETQDPAEGWTMEER